MEEIMTVIIIIIILLILYIVIRYNYIINLENRVKQSESGIDIYLTQRFDLIPNLVECVKAYSKHEENVFTKITESRSKYLETKNLKDGEIVEKQFKEIIAIGENYPELKADEQFLNLEKNLSKIESQLQAARRIYNSCTTKYNICINSFPSNIIAKIFKFKDKDLFEADYEANDNVKINI